MEQITSERRASMSRVALTIGLIVLAVAPLLLLLLQPSGPQPQTIVGNSNIFILAIPAFLAGILSFLSPCTLPILPAYFAFTFGAVEGAGSPRRRGRVLLASLAFFMGLATTIVLVGASITAVGSTVSQYRYQLAQIGGLVIIAFGVMSLLGKGFSGLKIKRRQSATIAGAYLYGMTFALGWTACVGPVLGAILTMLLAQGGTLVAGAILSFVYVLGLAIPLMLVAVFFGRLGQGSRFWSLLRGRGWEVRLAGHTLYLHSTSMISGVLLIVVGALLFSGQLSYLSQYATAGPGQWGLRIEQEITEFFGIY